MTSRPLDPSWCGVPMVAFSSTRLRLPGRSAEWLCQGKSAPPRRSNVAPAPGVAQRACPGVSSGRKVSRRFRNRLLTIQPELTPGRWWSIGSRGVRSSSRSSAMIAGRLRLICSTWSAIPTFLIVPGPKSSRSGTLAFQLITPLCWSQPRCSEWRGTSMKVTSCWNASSMSRENV